MSKPLDTSEPSHSYPPSLNRDEREDARSYLLRLWLSTSDGSCRASLQSVKTGERHMFANLESLLTYLVDQSQLRF